LVLELLEFSALILFATFFQPPMEGFAANHLRLTVVSTRNRK